MLTRIINKTPIKNERSDVYQIDELNSTIISNLLQSRFIEEGVYAIEIFTSDGYREIYLTAPSFDKFNYPTVKKQWDFSSEILKDLTVYEFKFAKPSFLPINTKTFIDLFNFLQTLKRHQVFCQILLCKRKNDWRDGVIDQYESYQEGVDIPFDNKVLRNSQNKIIRLIASLAKTNIKRDKIKEIEDKILQDNYRFECRIILFDNIERSNFEAKVIDELNKLTLFNEILLEKAHNKKDALINMSERCFDVDSSHQLVSKEEIFSMLSNNIPADVKTVIVDNATVAINNSPTTKQPSNIELEHSHHKISTENIIPTLEYEESNPIDNDTIHQIQHAFNRVGITKDSLEILDSFSGTTLHRLKIKIPSNINYNDISKHLKNIQASMGNESISIEIGNEPDTIHLYIPKEQRGLLYLGNILQSNEFKQFSSDKALPFVMGESTSGELLFHCMAELAHLLVAGATGSGKSVFLNNIIISLLTHVPPELLNLILIDPKEIEMPQYKGFPQAKVITDMSQSIETVESLCLEMDKRYSKIATSGYRNIKQYNNNSTDKIPYIVCVIDEYADLMMTNSAVEDYVVRIAQKARASGIHLIIGTQKPLSTILTSLLKGNLPSVIGFRMKTSSDYMTVFGKGIPYQLLGRGDGVAMIEGQLKEFERFQSPILTIDENEELEIFKKLRESFSHVEVPMEELQKENIPQEEPIDKLKRIIATHQETRITKLRELMGIRINVVHDLVQQLADDGWLKKENNKYEIVASEEELAKYKVDS